jgi:hypothetical protein
MSDTPDRVAEYRAAVRAAADRIGPLTDDQQRLIRAVFSDQRAETQQHRDTA